MLSIDIGTRNIRWAYPDRDEICLSSDKGEKAEGVVLFQNDEKLTSLKQVISSTVTAMPERVVF